MRWIRLRVADALSTLTIPSPNQFRILRECFRRSQLRQIEISPITVLAAIRRSIYLASRFSVGEAVCRPRRCTSGKTKNAAWRNVWVAHPFRVLVAVSRRNQLFSPCRSLVEKAALRFFARKKVRGGEDAIGPSRTGNSTRDACVTPSIPENMRRRLV